MSVVLHEEARTGRGRSRREREGYPCWAPSIAALACSPKSVLSGFFASSLDRLTVFDELGLFLQAGSSLVAREALLRRFGSVLGVGA